MYDDTSGRVDGCLSKYYLSRVLDPNTDDVTTFKNIGIKRKHSGQVNLCSNLAYFMHFNYILNLYLATAIDSRLEFSQQSPVRYTLLMGKAFPRLAEFTVCFWIKVTYTFFCDENSL